MMSSVNLKKFDQVKNYKYMYMLTYINLICWFRIYISSRVERKLKF